MALKNCYYNSKEFTLATSGGWKTLLILKAPTDLPLEVTNIGLQPQGINNAAKPVRFRLERVSDDGAGSTDVSSSIAVLNRPEAPLATVLEATAASGFSTEPASAARATMRGMAFHPQAPSDLPTLDRGERVVPGGGRVALQYNNDGGEAVNCETEITWGEG